MKAHILSKCKVFQFLSVQKALSRKVIYFLLKKQNLYPFEFVVKLSSVQNFVFQNKMEKVPKFSGDGRKLKDKKFSKNKKFSKHKKFSKDKKDVPKVKKVDILRESINNLKAQYDKIDTKSLKSFR